MEEIELGDILLRMRSAVKAHTDEEIEEIEAAEMREAAAERFERLYIPSRVKAVLSDLDDTAAIAEARKWHLARKADKLLWCLVLSGNKGVGKSVAAGWLIREMGSIPIHVDGGQKMAPWWPVTALARLGSYDGRFDAICKSRALVVIDDLGTEHTDKGGWISSALDGLIDARYSYGLPTVITTNLTGAEFKSRYLERISERIREGGVFVELRGASMRTGSMRCEK